MFYSWVRRGLMVLVFVGTAAGCDFPFFRSRAGHGLPLAEAPAELKGARLLYQRADGIYLRTLGQARSARLAAEGTFPRWAPDGKSFAFVRGDRIMHFDLKSKAERVLAEAARPRAVAFHPDAQQVFFTDGKFVKAVALSGGGITTIAKGGPFLELDVSSQGDFFAATVKARGYRVLRFDLPAGDPVEIGRGCSASISPNGQLVTVNLDGHEQVALRDSRGGRERGRVPAPAGVQLDNQQWSNHPDWIVAVTEGSRRDILVQRVGDSQAWRITDDGDADRPDLFVQGEGANE